MTSAKATKPTGSSSGGASDYFAPLPDVTRAISLDADYLRTQIDILNGEVQELQGEARSRDLADRTLGKSKKSVADLLEELTLARGMGWTDIAEVLGISVSAIRKWRKGGDASPGSRSKLAQIAALLDVLEEYGLVQDPASWMEIDLPLDPGFFIRPWDLYLEGHVTELIDLAQQRMTVAQVLDQVRPNWRDSRSDFEVTLDVDGERSIRHRER